MRIDTTMYADARYRWRSCFSLAFMESASGLGVKMRFESAVPLSTKGFP